jgi:hypothetical protein
MVPCRAILIGKRTCHLAGQGQHPAGGSSRCSEPASNAPRQLNACFRQVTEEFPQQENVGFLQLVIVAESELIRLGHDWPLVRLAKNALFNLLLTSKSLNSQETADDG